MRKANWRDDSSLRSVPMSYVITPRLREMAQAAARKRWDQFGPESAAFGEKARLRGVPGRQSYIACGWLNGNPGKPPP